MIEPVVADTHTLIWYLDGDQRLSTTAREALDAATADGQPIYVSPITILEASYLEEPRCNDKSVIRCTPSETRGNTRM